MSMSFARCSMKYRSTSADREAGQLECVGLMRCFRSRGGVRMFYGSLGLDLRGDCRQMGDGIGHPGHVDVVDVKRSAESAQ